MGWVQITHTLNNRKHANLWNKGLKIGIVLLLHAFLQTKQHVEPSYLLLFFIFCKQIWSILGEISQFKKCFFPQMYKMVAYTPYRKIWRAMPFTSSFSYNNFKNKKWKINLKNYSSKNLKDTLNCKLLLVLYWGSLSFTSGTMLCLFYFRLFVFIILFSCLSCY